jgi:hypothetical protein
MVTLTTLIAYYFCIALAFGISSSIGILRVANSLALEIGLNTIVEERPIVSYLAWIFYITLWFPVTMYHLLTGDMDEKISNIAYKLAVK